MTTKMRFGVIFIVAFALMGGLMPLAHAENVVAPTFAPPTGQTHLKGGDVVTFGGTVTEGAAVSAAFLSMTDTDQVEVRQENVKSALDVDTGAFTGSWQTVHIPSATTEIRLVVTVVHADGSEQTGTSSALPVDQVSPRIEHVEAIDEDEIRIIFSEPVLSPTGNQALDWRIDNLIPQTVTSNQAGDIRYLKLLAPIDEDETPYVQYVPRALFGAGSQPYRDGAGNTLTAQNNFAYAIDAIAPVTPVVASIDGKAPVDGKVLSTSSGPAVVVEQVTPGHTVDLFVESNGAEGLQRAPEGLVEADTQLGSEQAGDEGVTFAIADGTFSEGVEALLYTIANDAAQTPNFSAVHSVSYAVDLTAPVVESARAIADTVVVTFSEPLASGRDLPLDWSLHSNGATTQPVIVSVSGTGDSRVLQTLQDVPADTSVSYTAPEQDAYADAAGNDLADFVLVAAPGLVAALIDATPETSEAPVAQPHEITVSVTDQAAQAVPGTIVGFRAVGGPTATTNYDGDETTPLGFVDWCSTQGDGTCSIEYTSLELGTDEIQTWIDTDRDLSTIEHPGSASTDAPPGAQDVVEVEWTAKGAELQLDASPETAADRLVFTRKVDVSVTAVSTSDLFPPVTGDSRQIKGVNVDLRSVTEDTTRFLGECFTSADGTCSVTFGGENVGTDSIQAWIDRNFNDAVDDEDELMLPQTEMRNADGFLVVDDPAQDVIEVAWSLGLRSASLKAPGSTTFGRRVKLSGNVGGDSACRVTSVQIIRKKANRGPTTLKTVKTSSTGAWSYKFEPRSTATYSASIAPSSKCAGAVSKALVTKIRSLVKAKAKDRTLLRGQRLVITGRVAPLKYKRTVNLEIKSGRKWKVIRRDRLNKRSRFEFRGFFSGTGVRRFRVRYLGDKYNTAGSSRAIRVVVSRHRI